MYFTRGCLGLISLTILASMAYPQTDPATAEKDLVFVRVSVRDKKSGEFVRGLDQG